MSPCFLWQIYEYFVIIKIKEALINSSARLSVRFVNGCVNVS